MIRTLHIANYALITEIDIDFREGLNIITGETGAGKSIIIGALSLLLGDRADTRVVKDPEKKSVIEAEFSTRGFENLKNIFSQYDIEWDKDSCILRREIMPSGRSRAFVNDSTVTLQQLREISRHLVDIHSQHQNMLLADHAYQLAVIDTLAGNSQLLEEYREAYSTYRDLLRQYTHTRDMVERSRADAEFIAYQLEQLREMELKPGEQERLEHERDMLNNIADIRRHISGALSALSGDKTNALAQLAISTDHLSRLGDVVDEASSLAQRLESARLEVKDIAETLIDYEAGLNASPETLIEIEERLGRIYSLEMKHHVDNSDDLIKLRDEMAQRLDTIENADEALATLHDKARDAKRNATLIARRLSENRGKAARIFAEQLAESARPLGMNNLRCEIVLTTGKLSHSGIDEIDFRFAFNKNQTLASVASGASGGEISRLVLALKLVVAEKMQLPTIIFDEVDTGVSGDVALKMASLMARISENSQVIAITHLPQVAAKGSTHFKVYKEDDETSTNSHIQLLDPDQRIAEIATMLSGNPDDPAARATARSLIGDSD